VHKTEFREESTAQRDKPEICRESPLSVQQSSAPVCEKITLCHERLHRKRLRAVLGAQTESEQSLFPLTRLEKLVNHETLK